VSLSQEIVNMGVGSDKQETNYDARLKNVDSEVTHDTPSRFHGSQRKKVLLQPD